MPEIVSIDMPSLPRLDPRPYRCFVQALFQDVLSRGPSTEIAQDWVNQLVSGSSISTFASCLMHSQERRERWVTAQYEKYLGRTPNGEGLEFWTGLLSSGKRKEDVLAAILGSVEYFHCNGNTNEDFVRSLYTKLLGRRPSDAEVDSWVGLLHSDCATRMGIAHDFLSGDEYRTALITEWFWRYLRRQADVQGLRQWLDRMKAGMNQESAQVGILSTKEYFNSCLMRN